MTFEQDNAKVFLQRLHTRADAGLRHAERIGGMAEVQIFGDGECLDERREGNTRSQRTRYSPLSINYLCRAPAHRSVTCFTDRSHSRSKCSTGQKHVDVIGPDISGKTVRYLFGVSRLISAIRAVGG